jgi:hypothetical protein
VKDFKTSFNVKYVGGQIHHIRKKGDVSFEFPNGKIKPF